MDQQPHHRRLVQLQNDTLKHENEVLTQENAELRDMNQALKHENTTLSSQYARLRDCYKELKQSLNDAVKTEQVPAEDRCRS